MTQQATTKTLADHAAEAVHLATVEDAQGLPGGVKIRAIKHARDATGLSIRELIPAIDKAMEVVSVELAGAMSQAERAALAAWSRVSADTTGMLYAVRAALAVQDGAEDVRLAIAEAKLAALTGPEARDRLARHLYVTARGRDAESRAFAASLWDSEPSAELWHAWRRRADEALAVLAGKEG